MSGFCCRGGERRRPGSVPAPTPGGASAPGCDPSDGEYGGGVRVRRPDAPTEEAASTPTPPPPTTATATRCPRASPPPPALPRSERVVGPSNRSEGRGGGGAGSGGAGDGAPPPPFTFSGPNLAACNFPLGGFGAGQVHLAGDGALRGWHVLNAKDSKGDRAPRPAQDLPGCFFGVSAVVEGERPHNLVLVTAQNYTPENCGLPPHREGHVTPESVRRLRDLPGIRGLTLRGRYPIADVTYDAVGLPVDLSLEAMSPLIPGEANNSAFPAAVFTFTAKNSGTRDAHVRLMHGQANLVGWDGLADASSSGTSAPFWGGNVNAPFADGDGGLSGVDMSSARVDHDSAVHGTVRVAAVEGAARSRWDDGDGFVVVDVEGGSTTVVPGADSEIDLWRRFVDGEDVPPSGALPTPPSPAGATYLAGVVRSVTVPPGESRSASFVLTWHFANRRLTDMEGWGDALPAAIGAWYSEWWEDAGAVARAVRQGWDYLLPATRSYRDAVYGSALPENVVTSAAGRASVMGSPSMFRSRDGIVLGWEGNHCCPLNCSHVYGYGVLLERLFPEVAMDMMTSAFLRSWSDDVGVTMRYGKGGFAIDGALASVVKTYLCVLQGDGGLDWLPTVWDNVKRQMDMIMSDYDVDGDGCIRRPQQNTYDSAMRGANTFIGSYYVTALRAAARMATLMGEPDLARRYDSRAALSSSAYDEICWRDEYGYYVADVAPDDCENSYGPGCFVDQVCASGLSLACGLGCAFDPGREASARLAIARNNTVTRPPFRDLQGHMFDGDAATTTCSYPNGKLGKGMTYDTLVSIGWTYPVIAGLLHDRSVTQAMELNDMIRRRQDGRNRSPWNEPECDSHYTRMFSGWGLYDQGCGLLYDATRAFLAFDPRFDAESFRCFFAADGGWGTYSQEAAGPDDFSSGTVAVVALHGSFSLRRLGVLSFTGVDDCVANVDGGGISASLEDVPDLGKVVAFDSEVALGEGSTLTVKLRARASVMSLQGGGTDLKGI